MVMKPVDGVTCRQCQFKEAVVLCNGCEIALCSSCRNFDIWNHGCGSGDVKAFCEKCYNDPEVNLYRVSID